MNKNIASNASPNKQIFISPDQVLKLKKKQVKVHTTEKQPSNIFQSPYLNKNASFSKKESFLARNSKLDTPNYRIRIKKKITNQSKHALTQNSSIAGIETDGSTSNTQMIFYPNYNQIKQAT